MAVVEGLIEAAARTAAEDVRATMTAMRFRQGDVGGDGTSRSAPRATDTGGVAVGSWSFWCWRGVRVVHGAAGGLLTVPRSSRRDSLPLRHRSIISRNLIRIIVVMI
jgi:hypothetical protein